MLSSAQESNRYQEISDNIDHRSNGYRARQECLMKKPEAAITLVKRALDEGIPADYVLMDSWFTTEPMIDSLKEEGIDTIGMVSMLKQNYICTDCSLNEAEIARIYGNRWSIEVFFKAVKSFFKIGSEFQSRCYDAIVCHTSIVFTRYIVLEWIRRNQNDPKSYGELFFMYCDNIHDMDLRESLKSLMALFLDQIMTFASSENTSLIKSKLHQWMASQPTFIQALFGFS